MQPRRRKVSRPAFSVSAISVNDFFYVTLLAPGLEIFAVMHRPKPEFMTSVGLSGAIDRRSITPVAGRAAELLRIVDL